MIRQDAIYARQSVDRMDSISIESQIEYCKYELHGEPYRVYQDKGYSGKNTDRPAFQEMLTAIRKGEIKRVICYKLDRCSRSLLDFANMMEEFQQCSVEFVSCTEKFDTSTPMGRAMLSICIVFAQLERETIQQRVTDAYHSRSQKGFYMGGRLPYAFKLEPYTILGKKTSRYTPAPEEAEILRQIFLYYSDPQISVGDVITYLTTNGITNSRSRDGRWTKSYITSIIKNPVYVKADIEIYQFFKSQGAIILNAPKDFTGTNGCYLFSDRAERRKSLRFEGHSLVIAPHMGLIPSALWLKCRQKCMNNKQVAKPVKAKNTWLAGKLKCPHCGYGLIIRKWKDNRYYMCSRRLSSSGACEGVGGLIAEDIEQIIFNALDKRITELGSLHDQSAPGDNPQRHDLQMKIAQAQHQIDSYISSMAQASEAVLRYVNEKIDVLDGRIRVWKQELQMLEECRRRAVHGTDKIDHCMNDWQMLSIPDKIKIVDAFIVSIHASKERVSIRWKL